ncbi:MAG: hypothetical protein ABL962_19255, partial [Fimbriimonadaceae bacterium]
MPAPASTNSFSIKDAPQAVCDPFARLEAVGAPMRRFRLLLDCAEVVLRYAAARALSLRYEGTDIPAAIRNNVQRPSLGHFVAMLRDAIGNQDSKARITLLEDCGREWASGDGEKITAWILDVRNRKWGHGATLDDNEYVDLGDKLEQRLGDLLKVLSPLLRASTSVTSEEQPIDHEPALHLEPLVIQEGGKNYFFNGASESGIEYVCFSDGSQRSEPFDSRNAILFRERFPRPKELKELVANWHEGLIAAKTCGYQNRASVEDHIA